MGVRANLCETVTITGNGVVDLSGGKNQKNYLNLKEVEIINGTVITIQTATVAGGFTGGGSGKIKVQESADGTNWTDVSGITATLAAADTTYTLRITGSVLPLKSRIRLLFYDYDSGNYIVDIIMYRLSGE